jgi:two-component system response regulator YesN
MDDGRHFWVEEAERYIAACGERRSSIRASEFALQVRRTPAQLAREFHASVGQCVKQYFVRRQLDRAKELLRTTGRTTQEIAIEAGFGTPRTFYRLFKRCTGQSPTEYRQESSLALPEVRH